MGGLSRLNLPLLPFPCRPPRIQTARKGRPSNPDVAQEKRTAQNHRKAPCKWSILPTHVLGVPPCRVVGSCRTDSLCACGVFNIPHMRSLVGLASIQYRGNVWMGKPAKVTGFMRRGLFTPVLGSFGVHAK